MTASSTTSATMWALGRTMTFIRRTQGDLARARRPVRYLLHGGARRRPRGGQRGPWQRPGRTDSRRRPASARTRPPSPAVPSTMSRRPPRPARRTALAHCMSPSSRSTVDDHASDGDGEPSGRRPYHAPLRERRRPVVHLGDQFGHHVRDGAEDRGPVPTTWRRPPKPRLGCIGCPPRSRGQDGGHAFRIVPVHRIGRPAPPCRAQEPPRPSPRSTAQHPRRTQAVECRTPGSAWTDPERAGLRPTTRPVAEQHGRCHGAACHSPPGSCGSRRGPPSARSGFAVRRRGESDRRRPGRRRRRHRDPWPESRCVISLIGDGACTDPFRPPRPVRSTHRGRGRLRVAPSRRLM